MKKRLRLFYVLFTITIGLTIGVNFLHATTIYIGPTHTYKKIQDAINNASSGDVLLVEPDVYNETINFLGKQIQLISISGPAVTVIDGSSGGSVVVTFNSWEQRDTVLEGFTIKNGSGTKLNGLEYGFGGGILCIGSSPTIRKNIIENNKADPAEGLFGMGGGICVIDGSYPEITQNIIRQNQAEMGGGIFLARKSDPGEYGSAAVVITNNVIYSNISRLGGGIAITEHARPQLINNTIADNTAQVEGGGIWIDVYSAQPYIKNTIIWGNGDDISGALQGMVSYCDIEDGDFQGIDGNISQNPNFISSGNYHIIPQSVCVDAGNNVDAPEFDIDGESRPVDGNSDGTSVVDIGADEVFGPTLITLSSFTATALNKKVKLCWVTASEIYHVGFNLYRAEDGTGHFKRINPALIPSQGSPLQGASYEFIDCSVKNRTTYYYKLEDIDITGKSTQHGPVSATPGLFPRK